MRGNITRRGRSSWRLKFDLGRDAATGRRITRFVTIKGKRTDAERELTRLLNSADAGTFVEPSKLTVAAYLESWLGSAAVSSLGGKTIERYRQLVRVQIAPHLGAVLLQKLRPAHLQDWHGTILRSGRHDGGALAARTVGHAHRVLHKALAQAAATEIITRNVAAIVAPPKVESTEIEILSAGQVADVLKRLEGMPIYPIVAVALATGMRRGEILALRWQDIDLEADRLRVEQSLEQTKAGGLRFKSPKTRAGRRSIALPPQTVAVLRDHRRRQLELRLALGAGKLPADALVFARYDGSPRSPRALSKEWSRLVSTRGLPLVTFHALRHSHASALIASGLDVLTISRRLGHGSPAITLGVYGHLFSNTDDKAAEAISAVLGPAPAAPKT